MSSRHHLKQIVERVSACHSADMLFSNGRWCCCTRVRPEKSCSGLLSQMMRIVRKEEKMGRISMIDPETASPEVKAEIARHTAEGHKITNEKRTLLHNIHAFRAVEEASYALDDDLQRLIGKLDGDLFEYAVSVSNDCLVCTTYFSKLLREEHHLDPNHFVLTHRQELLMNFGKKVGHTPKEITDEEFEELKQDFLQHGGRDGEPVDEEKAEEIMVVLTAMGAMMVANNYVNDVLRVDV